MSEPKPPTVIALDAWRKNAGAPQSPAAEASPQGNAPQGVNDYTQAIMRLPPVVQQDIFKAGIKLPTAFLKSFATIAEQAFPEDEPESNHQYVWKQKLNRFRFALNASADFFDSAEKGAKAIPDAVWEILGADLQNTNPYQLPSYVSAEAREIHNEAWGLQFDPYPKEAPYAGTAARFVFLIDSYWKLSDFTASMMRGTPDQADIREWQKKKLNPLRTLDAEKSGLERYVVNSVEFTETMIAHDGKPVMEALRIVRYLSEDYTRFDTKTVLESAGIKDPTASQIKLYNGLQNHYSNDFSLNFWETHFQALRFAVMPAKFLQDFAPETPDPVRDFVMLLPVIGLSPDPGRILQEHFPEHAQTYQQWIDVIGGRLSWDDLPPDQAREVANIVLCHEMVLLERIAADLDQDLEQLLEGNNDIADIKASLFRLREAHHTAGTYCENTDLFEIFHEMLFDAFDRFDRKSRQANFGRGELRIVTPPRPSGPAGPEPGT